MEAGPSGTPGTSGRREGSALGARAGPHGLTATPALPAATPSRSLAGPGSQSSSVSARRSRFGGGSQVPAVDRTGIAPGYPTGEGQASSGARWDGCGIGGRPGDPNPVGSPDAMRRREDWEVRGAGRVQVLLLLRFPEGGTDTGGCLWETPAGTAGAPCRAGVTKTELEDVSAWHSPLFPPWMLKGS